MIIKEFKSRNIEVGYKSNWITWKQCIVFRGHRENVASNLNSSRNFLAILKLLAQTNDDLQNHLTSSVIKSATYLSPKIQNENINITVYDILQADWKSLPICIRLVDKNNNIREEFLGFGRCEQLSGKVIGTEIIWMLEKSNLDIKNCHGQGYDGASNMSSEAVGVQKQIKKCVKKPSTLTDVGIT